jgi:hypothetical protein
MPTMHVWLDYMSRVRKEEGGCHALRKTPVERGVVVVVVLLLLLLEDEPRPRPLRRWWWRCFFC